jgi:pantoate--beta-alanine ligase
MTAGSPLPVARNTADLRAAVGAWRVAGERVALVPTMGALHEGHLSLIRLARERADRVVASLFINPKQFSPSEDLDRYPRQESKDAELLAGAGCALLFAPDVEAMYPDGFATAIEVGGPSQGLETAFRPLMFGGVATVVGKLLIQAQADVAVFGEKDYQQLLVIRRLVRDLDLPVEIVAGATVREKDGLAMSSRNAYLAPEQRWIAGRLNGVLLKAARRAADGDAVAEIEKDAHDEIAGAGFDRVDYVAVRRAEDLGEFIGVVDAPARVLAAARIGATRLIDNVAV